MSASPFNTWGVARILKTIRKLQAAKNLSDLAKILGYKPKSLSFILYKIPDADKYSEFTVPKSGGGDRLIKAPVDRLKVLQRRLASLLQAAFEEIYGDRDHGRSLSHGFRWRHSIITNASNHKNKRYVFNIDLEEFFPSINFGRVRGFFIKSTDFQLNPKVATVIAQIACHDNQLPQGSPVSPVISNLLGHVLDVRLVRLAKKARCTYSRYADDITFSTREKEFPLLIAQQSHAGVWGPSDQLMGLVNRAGFRINHRKVSMQYETSRQMTTGLVVNRKVNIRAAYYRQARAMCDALFRTGRFCIGKEMRWGEPKDSATPLAGTVNQLRGVLSHIYGVKKLHDDRDIQDRWRYPTAIHELFRRFLYFDKFHNLSQPLIMCEGKTDNVYLRCALKSLAATFPSMIDISGSEIEWHIDFFKHSELNMDLMRFSGGSGDFPKFIGTYKQQMARFLSNGKAFPVILLIDNDSGASAVKSAAKKITHSIVDGTHDFYHLGENLYLILQPLPVGKSEVEIEDCFEPAVLSTVLDGKSFNPNSETFDPGKHYGKHVFAEKVVKANQGTLDFSGFEPLLKRLEAAISDYAGRAASP